MGQMTSKQPVDQYNTKETEQRLQKILQGAVSGPPTPLKDIPTRDGESRKLARKKPQRRLRRQRKKRALKTIRRLVLPQSETMELDLRTRILGTIFECTSHGRKRVKIIEP
jgi:hypothetical protein